MTRKKMKGGKEKKERVSLVAKKEKVLSVSKVAGKYPVVALLNIRALPDRILQSSRKKLRGEAEFSVAKNSVLSRALQSSGKGALAEHLDFPTAIVSTSKTPYSLFKFFKDNKVKVAAKPGQIAPFDIVVPEGETDLLPGPALSELKSAGINAQIKAGKIVVAKDSVIAKAGTKISDAV
ncbi:MAG: 50S ribosomal protein L10, partial [Candidatus Anstonellaceae archaeon]